VFLFRRQLAEIEGLVQQRNNKLEDLRQVIRVSHTEVITSKQAMNQEVIRCKSLGVQVYGVEYVPPAEGADKIRNISSRVASRVFFSFLLSEVLISLIFMRFCTFFHFWGSRHFNLDCFSL
jgi:hypothetical protein